MPNLNCEISESLMQALLTRSQRTGEPLAHVVMTALADALELDHATLFQVSTSSALVKGVYNGVVTAGELKQHGDFGLGTFDDLDGEMVALDGHFYQVRGNHEVTEVADDSKLPFAVVTNFRPQRTATIDSVTSFDALTSQLDTMRRTENLFCAVRLTAQFDSVQCRAVCKASPGESLLTAASHQREFTFTNVRGTLVGFWTPSYARTLNVAGWHLHFITADHTGGGHVLDCQASNLRLEIEDLDDVRIAMPETAAFLQADLSQDPSQVLNQVERQKHSGS
jgi:acetolactate decarboxylase